MTTSAAAADPAVEVEDLVVTRGSVRAVDGVSFAVPSGAITVLLGPNGAGKTSTVEHLEGYLARSSGRSSVLGLDPSSQRRKLAGRVGLMLQSGGIPNAIKPLELLRQYASFFDAARDPGDLLELVGLARRARTAYRRLSGGEKQRLSLALALVGRPELLFLDEPTAGVDLEGRDLIRSLITSLRDEGTTVLITTHDLADAEQLAERVLIMHRGRLVADGSPDQLAAAERPSDLRFSTRAGLDTQPLARRLAGTVTEPAPGRYVADVEPTPDAVAVVTAFLADRGEQLSDLRAGGASLEDVYRRVTTGDHR